MSGVYESLKLKVQDTLQRGKTDSMPLARVKSTDVSNLNQELDGLEKLVADTIGKLKAAVTAGEATVVEEARQAEQLTGSLKADIAKLESKLKETEATIERKDFSRQKMEETLTIKIKELENDIKKNNETLATRDNEINDYKSKIDDKVKLIGELELANKKAKEDAASVTKRAEDLADSSQRKITAVESRLKEAEKLAGEKESIIKELQQKLAAKVQEFESVVTDKQKLDAEINDLRSQLKRLAKGIGDMSSFFKQAEALAGIEVQGVSTAAQKEPVAGPKEKPAAVQSNTGKVTPIVPEAAGEMVSSEIFQQIIRELAQVTNVIAPLASLLVHQQAKALGESVEKFPRTRLPELLEALVQEISDENRQIDFRNRLAQSVHISLN